jgi:hypothetical protein
LRPAPLIAFVWLVGDTVHHPTIMRGKNLFEQRAAVAGRRLPALSVDYQWIVIFGKASRSGKSCRPAIRKTGAARETQSVEFCTIELDLEEWRVENHFPTTV